MLLVVIAALGVFGDRQGVVRSIDDESFAIMVVHDGEIGRYPSLASLRKYARDRSYTWIERTLRPCGTSRNLFFRKQCMVRETLTTRPPGTWIFVCDADVAVANPNVKLESFVYPSSVVMYERFHNNEIVAGAYMIRNDAVGLAFLDRWIAMEKHGKANADNGALMALLGGPQCFEAWPRNVADGIKEYFSFVSTCKREMGLLDCSPFGPPRTVGDVTVLRRGHGMALDYFIMGPGSGKHEDWGGVNWPWSFLLHGTKKGVRMLGTITASRIELPTTLDHDHAVLLMHKRDQERRLVNPSAFTHCEDH